MRRAVATAVQAFGSASIDISELVGRGALKSTPYTALASEEADEPEFGDPSALISIAYDPLDGSSNFETNTAVGTIFSILPGHSLGAPF